MREVVVLKGKLKIVEMTFQSLKDAAHKSRREVTIVQSNLLLAKVDLGAADTRLWNAEWKAYGWGFEECKS